jgi:hypothetical protein
VSGEIRDIFINRSTALGTSTRHMMLLVLVLLLLVLLLMLLLLPVYLTLPACCLLFHLLFLHLLKLMQMLTCGNWMRLVGCGMAADEARSRRLQSGR